MDRATPSQALHPETEGKRKPSARLIAVGGLWAGIAFGVAACSGLFSTPTQVPTLHIGDVQVTGREGYVLVSVADMPGGGVAAIQFGEVGDEAIALAGIEPASVRIEGRSGFVVLAKEFGAARGALVAANGAAGVAGGEILKFTFAVIGANPTFTVSKAKVRLSSDAEAFITTWSLKTGTDYVYVAR